MAAQYLHLSAISDFSSVTDLINRASIFLESAPSKTLSCPLSSIQYLDTSVIKKSNSLNYLQYTSIHCASSEAKTCASEAATALTSAAAAISETAKAFSSWEVPRARQVHPVDSAVEFLAFIGSSLSGVCTALARILAEPRMAEFVPTTEAKTLVSAATATEDNANSLVRSASAFTSLIFEQMSNRSSYISKGSQCNMNVSDSKSSANPKSISKNDILEKFGYTLGSALAYGTFSVIKEAHSKLHNRKVAIKIMSRSQVPKIYEEKFLPREVQVAQTIRHPNVIKYLQIIETNICAYFVMEYAAQGSLCDVIRREKIPEIRAKRWFRQLVSAVHYCHKRGIVHRDIKCENIWVDAQDNIKLSEFHFTRHETTLSQTFCGTEAYAAPEVLQCSPYDPKLSEVWSLGIVLFAIVYARLPFGRNDLNLLRKKLSESQCKVIFPKKPEISSDCKSLINGMLAPAHRRIDVPSIRHTPWLTLQPSHPETIISETAGVEEVSRITKENKSAMLLMDSIINRLRKRATRRNISDQLQ